MIALPPRVDPQLLITRIGVCLGALAVLMALGYVVGTGGSAILFFAPVPAIAAIWLLMHPDVGPYLILLTLPLTAYTIPHMPFGAELTTSDVITLITVAGMAVQSKHATSREPMLHSERVLLFLAAVFMTDSALTLLVAANMKMGLVEVIHYTEFFIGVHLVFSRLVTTTSVRDRLLTLILATGLASGALASVQYLSSDNALYRASALFSDFNALGAFLSMIVPLALALFGATDSRRYRLFLIAVIAVCCYGTVATLSRGGVISLLVGVLLVATILRGRVLIVTAVSMAMGIGALLLLAPGSVLDRFGSVLTGSDSTDARPILWRTAWQDALQHPLLGLGANNFQTYAPEKPGYIVFYNDPHSMLLKIASETGFPSLIIFLVYLSVLLAMLARVIQWGGARERAVAVGLLGSCAAFFIGGLFGSPIVRGHGMLFFALIGLSCATDRLARAGNAASTSPSWGGRSAPRRAKESFLADTPAALKHA